MCYLTVLLCVCGWLKLGKFICEIVWCEKLRSRWLTFGSVFNFKLVIWGQLVFVLGFCYVVYYIASVWPFDAVLWCRSAMLQFDALLSFQLFCALVFFCPVTLRVLFVVAVLHVLASFCLILCCWYLGICVCVCTFWLYQGPVPQVRNFFFFFSVLLLRSIKPVWSLAKHLSAPPYHFWPLFC